MIAILIFPIIATALVMFAGRKDSARDPQLTLLLLALLAILPAMVALMPKIEILPTSAPASAEGKFPWMTLVYSLWFVGFVYSLGKIFIAGFVIARWRKNSVLLDTDHGVSIRALADLRSPVATGISRKIVFVPADWNALPANHRKIVLAHEIAHHQKHDPLLRLCVELARAFNWWNPLVHWMTRRYIMQSECACDEFVLRQGTDAKTYANVLCDFAEDHSPNSFALAMADTSSLERRVGRILAGKNRPNALLLGSLGVLGLTAACALAMLDSQPKIDPAEVELRFSANPFPGEE